MPDSHIFNHLQQMFYLLYSRHENTRLCCCFFSTSELYFNRIRFLFCRNHGFFCISKRDSYLKWEPAVSALFSKADCTIRSCRSCCSWPRVSRKTCLINLSLFIEVSGLHIYHLKGDEWKSNNVSFSRLFVFGVFVAFMCFDVGEYQTVMNWAHARG